MVIFYYMLHIIGEETINSNIWKGLWACWKGFGF